MKLAQAAQLMRRLERFVAEVREHKVLLAGDFNRCEKASIDYLLCSCMLMWCLCVRVPMCVYVRCANCVYTCACVSVCQYVENIFFYGHISLIT